MLHHVGCWWESQRFFSDRLNKGGKRFCYKAREGVSRVKVCDRRWALLVCEMVFSVGSGLVAGTFTIFMRACAERGTAVHLRMMGMAGMILMEG